METTREELYCPNCKHNIISPYMSKCPDCGHEAVKVKFCITQDEQNGDYSVGLYVGERFIIVNL